MKKQRLTALALAAVLALSLTACGGGGEETPEEETGPQGVAVQVQEITADTIYAENTVSGRLTAEDEDVIMVAVSAKCTAVYAEAGDEVKAGDVLCTLDLASTLSSYDAASIGYRSAVQSYNDQAAVFEKQIALQEKNVSDLKALFEIGAASQIEIDQAELQLQSSIATRNSTLAQLEAGMQSYKSNVEQLSAVLENVDSQGNVIAPISGTIIALNAAEGSYVTPSAPVAVIDGVDQLEVSVSVSEALVPKLAEGDEVDVSISALGKQLVGSIKKIENTASMQTKLYNVTISILEDVEGLMSGMFADVSFRTDTSADTIVIPTEAILTSNGAQYVIVVDGIVEGRGTARYAAIGTGLTGSGVTEVTSGLGAGDMLVTVGQAYLSDGDAVRIVTGED